MWTLFPEIEQSGICHFKVISQDSLSGTLSKIGVLAKLLDFVSRNRADESPKMIWIRVKMQHTSQVSYLWTSKTINYVWKYFSELFMFVLPLIFGYFWVGSEFNPFAWISSCVISLLFGFLLRMQIRISFWLRIWYLPHRYIHSPHHSIQLTLDLIKQ